MGNQMVDFYGRPCDVQPIRTFKGWRQLGVGYFLLHLDRWFVFDRETDNTGNRTWHSHCGPFSSFDEAKAWVKALKEE